MNSPTTPPGSPAKQHHGQEQCSQQQLCTECTNSPNKTPELLVEPLATLGCFHPRQEVAFLIHIASSTQHIALGLALLRTGLGVLGLLRVLHLLCCGVARRCSKVWVKLLLVALIQGMGLHKQASVALTVFTQDWRQRSYAAGQAESVKVSALLNAMTCTLVSCLLIASTGLSGGGGGGGIWMLLEPGRPAGLALTGLLSIFDMLRLQTLVYLYPVKLFCFLLVQSDGRVLFRPKAYGDAVAEHAAMGSTAPAATCWQLCCDAGAYCLLGLALPLLVSLLFEAQLRGSYLLQQDRPLAELPPPFLGIKLLLDRTFASLHQAYLGMRAAMTAVLGQKAEANRVIGPMPLLWAVRKRTLCTKPPVALLSAAAGIAAVP